MVCGGWNKYFHFTEVKIWNKIWGKRKEYINSTLFYLSQKFHFNITLFSYFLETFSSNDTILLREHNLQYSFSSPIMRFQTAFDQKRSTRKRIIVKRCLISNIIFDSEIVLARIWKALEKLEKVSFFFTNTRKNK